VADFRFELAKGALARLLKEECAADLRARGERVLAAAGSEFYRLEAGVAGRRFRVAVIGRDARAAAHEAKHHTLLNAFDSARG